MMYEINLNTCHNYECDQIKNIYILCKKYLFHLITNESTANKEKWY